LAGNSRRLFFALWPDATVRRELAALQTLLPQTQGNWVHGDDLHMTLQFLGSVAAKQQHCISKAADRTSGDSFVMSITHLDYWAGPGIVWAGLEELPQALSALVSDLGGHLENCGLRRERRAYRPHVTLLRKAPPSGMIRLETPIIWEVDHFVLVESRPGGHPPWYRVLESWPLDQ